MRETFFVAGRKFIFDSAQKGEPHAIWLHSDIKLGDQQPVLAQTFSLVIQELRLRKLSAETFQNDSFNPQATSQFHSFRKLKSHEQGAALFSGTLFVALNSVLFDLRKQLKLPVDKFYQVGRRVGRSTLPQVIRAASNNFRHFEEWHKPKGTAVDNITALRKAGVRGPIERNVCAEVFEILEWRNPDGMFEEIRGVMEKMYQLSV